ncbi:hypothetical protein EYF80_041991 [Liparis tanakae]|uniref:Uncharacterized protein n=1 Tax=Liparis tanakae TaxID=230148 RepID=A0A4Z2G4T0_9TELE|nr:hypothetical protein EYF80_041991 [Liparis tanakae]
MLLNSYFITYPHLAVSSPSHGLKLINALLGVAPADLAQRLVFVAARLHILGMDQPLVLLGLGQPLLLAAVAHRARGGELGAGLGAALVRLVVLVHVGVDRVLDVDALELSLQLLFGALQVRFHHRRLATHTDGIEAPRTFLVLDLVLGLVQQGGFRLHRRSAVLVQPLRLLLSDRPLLLQLKSPASLLLQL